MNWSKAFNAFFAAVWFLIFVATLIDQEPVSWYNYALAMFLLVISEITDLVRD